MLIEHGANNKLKILIVDDEQAVLESLVDLLYRDFHIYATDDPDVALKLLGALEFALILCDQRMPAASGWAVLAKAARITPYTVRVLLTAYSDFDALIQSVNEGKIHHYLAKPWQPQQLPRFIHKAVETYVLAAENRLLIQKIAELSEAVERPGLRRTEEHGLREMLARDNQALRGALNHLECSYWRMRMIRNNISACRKCGVALAESERWTEMARLIEENFGSLSQGFCPHCQSDQSGGMDN